MARRGHAKTVKQTGLDLASLYRRVARLEPNGCGQAGRWAETAYSNLIHYNKVDTGGHVAAWEQLQLPFEEPRASFRPLR